MNCQYPVPSTIKFFLFWKRSTEPKTQPNSHWQIRQQNTPSIFYPVHSKGEGKIWPVVITLVLSCYFGLHMQCLFSVCYLLDNYYCPLLLSYSCYCCFFFIITIIGIVYYLYSFSFNNHFWLLTEDILCRLGLGTNYSSVGLVGETVKHMFNKQAQWWLCNYYEYACSA